MTYKILTSLLNAFIQLAFVVVRCAGRWCSLCTPNEIVIPSNNFELILPFEYSLKVNTKPHYKRIIKKITLITVWQRMVFFLFILQPHLTYAHDKVDSLGHKQPDTTYIKSFSDKIIVKLDLDNDYIRFKLTGDDFKYDIRPNLSANRTLSVNYRWAYVGVSYLPDLIVANKWNDRKGETNAFGISGGVTTPRFLADIGYINAKGFYLHNTSDYEPNWNPDSDPYIQFPDLRIWMIRGNALYKTNPNFSLRAIQTQTEAQRKSATSFMPGLVYHYYVIDNKGASSSSSQRSKNLMILAQLNYYATLVLHKKWYATLGVGAGGGFYYSWLLTRQPSGNIESTLSHGVVRGFLNSGLGYNGDRFIAGAELLLYQSFTKQTNNIEMVFTRTAFQVFIGYRFNAPGFLKRGFDKLER